MDEGQNIKVQMELLETIEDLIKVQEEHANSPKKYSKA